MKNLFLKTKSVLLIVAALFSASLAFAETGSETEKNATGGASSNAQVDGVSYYIAGTYIAGTGSGQTGDMTSKGFKVRTAQDGKRVVFTVQEGYTITSLSLTGASNYALNDGGTTEVHVIKVEVDGTEVAFTGGEAFKNRADGESCTLTISGIEAKETIAIYFDNGDSKGSQINASWAITWERPDATQPTITVTPSTVALLPGATFHLTTRVDPASFTTAWVSDNEAVATVAADGTVTAVAPGVANISNAWDQDATVAGTTVVTVPDLDIEALTAVKTYDFKTLGTVTLAIEGTAAGKIWNEANNRTNDVFFLTNEGLEDIAVQAILSGGKGWSIENGQGLVLASGAGRCAAIGHLKAGQIVEIIYTGSEFFTGSKNDAQRKDDGAEKTALNQSVGRAIYQLTEDGLLGFEITKGKAIEKIVVYEESAPAPTSVTATIPATITDGTSYYTTFSSTLPLDLSEVEGLKAYVATSLAYDAKALDGIGALVANLVEVGKVPANTGLLLVGTEAKDYTIPVAEGEVPLDVENRLIAAVEDVQSNTVKNPYRLTLSYGVVSFDSPWNETLPAGTAYLSLTDSEQYDAYGFVGLKFTSGDGDDDTPATDEPAEYENIAALKAATDAGEAKLKLVNAQITYIGTSHDDWSDTDQENIVIEDATGAFLLQDAGLADFVKAGDILNGTLNLKVESAWSIISFTGSSTTLLSDLKQGSGTVTPLDLSDDVALLSYLANSDWRLAKFTGATVSVDHGTYGDDVYFNLVELGDKFPVQDLLGTNLETPAEGAKVNVVGYIYSLYGMQAFQPVSIEVVPEEPAAPTSVTATIPSTITDGTSYYTTFSSTLPLDLSEVEGLKAYVATSLAYDAKALDGIGALVANLVEVGKVPANTGLLLVGTEAKDYTIPVAEGEVPLDVENRLIAAVEDVQSNTVKNPYRLTLSYGVVSFDSPWNETLPAGTAYLSLTDSEQYDAYGFVGLKFTSGDGDDDTPATDEPAEYENIAALKAATDAGEAKLKLVNAQITYIGTSHDDWSDTDQENIVIEDATGAFLLQDAGLADFVKAGDILNGTLNLKVESAWSIISFTGSSTTLLSDLKQGSGTVTPLDLSDDVTLLSYLANSDWRLAKFTGATVSVDHGTYGDDVYFNLVELGDKFPVQDLLGTNLETPAEGAKVNVVGYIYSLYGMQAFQPVSIEVVPEEPAAPTSVTATIPSTITDGTSYYTTFSSTLPLDLSEVEGLKAYVVKSLTYDSKANDGLGGIVANLVEVDKAPANTGLLLVGTEATDYTVPVAEGEVTLDVENRLIAVDADVQSNTLTNPYKLSFSYGEISFVNLWSTETFAAGTAYLSLTASEDDDAWGFVGLKFTSGDGDDDTPATDEPAEYENIAALKAATDAGEAKLKLVNAQITYIGTSHDDWSDTDQENIVIEDATGAFLLQDAGLADFVKAGDILNGTLNLKVESAWSIISFTGSSTTLLSDLKQGSGTVTPLDLSDDVTLLSYLADSDWRLAKFTGATVSVEHGTYGDDVYFDLVELGDKFPVYDLLGTNLETPAEGAKVNVVGYIYSLYGIQSFQPVSIEVVPEEPIVDGIATLKTATEQGTVYNLNGRKVQKAQKKGLYIINGKKVVVK